MTDRSQVDVNIEPAKDDILFENADKVLQLVKECFELEYGKIEEPEVERIPIRTEKKAQPVSEYQNFDVLLSGRTRNKLPLTHANSKEIGSEIVESTADENRTQSSNKPTDVNLTTLSDPSTPSLPTQISLSGPNHATTTAVVDRRGTSFTFPTDIRPSAPISLLRDEAPVRLSSLTGEASKKRDLSRSTPGETRSNKSGWLFSMHDSEPNNDNIDNITQDCV